MLYIQLQNLKSKEEEQKIISVLRWKTIPKTINTWLNWNLCQWDLFFHVSIHKKFNVNKIFIKTSNV